MAKELDPEAPWTHPAGRRMGRDHLRGVAGAEVADELARDLLRSWLAGGFLTKPAHTFSLLQGLWVIAGAGGTYELFEPDSASPTGSSGLAAAPASGLRSVSANGSCSTRPYAGSAGRTGAWRSTRAASARPDEPPIVAVPPNLTGAIRFEPALPGWRMRLEQGISQGVVIKALAVYDHPFWREDGLSGQGFAPYQLVRELYDNSPPSGEPGVLLTFLAGENAEAAARLTPEARRAAVLDGFADYVGPEARDATEYHELDWSAEEWTRGAYAATFGVGGLTRFGPDLRRPIGPIHWACTDIAGVGHMHMDGAIRSGEAAARRDPGVESLAPAKGGRHAADPLRAVRLPRHARGERRADREAHRRALRGRRTPASAITPG